MSSSNDFVFLFASVLLACAPTPEPPRESDAKAPAKPPTTDRGSADSTADAPHGRIEAGFYIADGAPDPLACTADPDCSYGGVPDAGGCCWTYRDYNAVAMSTAYRDWVNGTRGARCKDVACPSPPVPAQPPDCLFEVACRDARCVNACPQ